MRAGPGIVVWMKRKVAKIVAVGSVLYLLVAGPLPDPIPLLDEGVMLWLFAWAMKELGHDVAQWLPLFGKGRKERAEKAPGRASEATVDV